MPRTLTAGDGIDLVDSGSSLTIIVKRGVTPESKGAAGNNSTDDSTAVAAAFNDALSNGTYVELRPGATYLLSTWSAFSNASRLIVQGNGATLRGPASTVDFLTPAADFVLRDVVFDRWSSVVERLRASSGSYDEFRIEGCTIKNCDGQAINIERPVARYWITDCRFESCSGGYAVRIGENTYANQDDYQRGTIARNRFLSLSASGTTSCAAVLVYGRAVEIEGNDIDGVSQSGTGEAWGIYTKVRYGRVIGNHVNNVVAAGNADNVGINIKGTTRAVTSSPQGFANLVIGNHVRNIGSAGVRGSGIRAQTDDVQIAHNLIEDPGTNGVVSDESAAHSNVAIEHNQVRYASAVAGTFGIRIEGLGTDVHATHNRITNATTGVILTASVAGTFADARVAHNKVRGATNGIIYDAQTGATLANAEIDFNTVTGGTYGVLNNGSAGTVTRLKLRHNDLYRCGTPQAGSLGTNSTSQDNITT